VRLSLTVLTRNVASLDGTKKELKAKGRRMVATFEAPTPLPASANPRLGQLSATSVPTRRELRGTIDDCTPEWDLSAL
jgi:hypothetical protein